MNFIIIIPARFFSSRFPKKLLANIHGKPMIIRVIEKALATKTKKVIVAIDNVIIKETIESEYKNLKNRIEICSTKTYHKSGIERISEVIEKYRFENNQCIVHLQADEPLISPKMIHQVVHSLYTHDTKNNISVTTLAAPINSIEEAQDTNVVKVVTNVHNHALYFSRSSIPWTNASFYDINCKKFLLRHIGIYSYRANLTYRYMKWENNFLEKLENLEQLRILWHGEKIYVSVINEIDSISVNTLESLQRANKLFKTIKK